jgi:GGDEF domain-containing protein
LSADARGVSEPKRTAREISHSVDEVGLDALTGVWNRAGFMAAATPMFALCQRRATPVTLAYFDIRSGREPDSAARLEGVLQAVGQQMGKTFRDCDIIGRIDTFRFAVLFADCTSEALGAIEGVRAVTDESVAQNERVLSIAMVESSPGVTLGDLMLEADARAKESRSVDAVDAPRDARVSAPADAKPASTKPVPTKPVPAKSPKRWAKTSR